PRPLDGPSLRGCFFHAARSNRQQVLRRECSWSWFSSLPWVVEVRLLRHSIGRRLCYLLWNRSTTGRVPPARTDILTVFNDARHGRIAAGIREHFCTPRFVGLCVVVDEWDA